jgi:uncharacterized protein YndB with AHSA1/START domain
MGSKNANSRSVEKNIEIAAPVAAVWKALTEAEEIKRWFPLDAGVTPGVGGTIRLTWADKFEWKLKIEVSVTEKHLRLIYRNESDFSAKETEQKGLAGQMAIDYFLEGKGGKTALRLVHSGFGKGTNWDEEFDSVSRGWTSELGNLKHYLENHPGEERLVAWATTELSESIDSAWQKIMSADGILKSGNLSDLKLGAKYSITTSVGDNLSGDINLLNPPYDFMATVSNLNDAYLRIYLEDYRGMRYVTIWLSAYGLPKSQVADFEQRYNSLLRDLYRANPSKKS